MAVVERTVTLAELDDSYLSLSEAQARTLDLPEFTGHVVLRFQGEMFTAEWNARSRRVIGEFVADEVAAEAQIGSGLRWTRDGEDLVLEVVEARVTFGSRPASRFVGFDPVTPPQPVSSRTNGDAARRRRRSAGSERSRNRVSSDFDWSGKVGVAHSSRTALEKSLTSGGWDDPASFMLRLRGERLACLGGFDELLGVAASAVEPMPHQLAAVSKALSTMNGRAILADEVGLGKTIEAGLVLKELDLRGLASRVLIITPATLREQWKSELAEKFGLEASVIASGAQPLEGQRLVMSLQLARNRRAELARRQWDMLILDEAHRAAGAGAKATRELLESLDSRYRLFLTATPVNNDLLELYRLVSLLRPGTFQSQQEFSRKFISYDDRRRPTNAKDLRQLVSSVMIRTTREQTALDRVRRHAVDVPVLLSPEERSSYDLVVQILREVLNGPNDRMRRESLTRALTLSPRGLFEAADRAAGQHQDRRTRGVLAELADIAADAGPTSRQRAAIGLVREWLDDPAKGRVIVFTQHTRVLADIQRVLQDEGIDAVAYHGGLAAKAKAEALAAFRGDVRVLVSTDAGAEGLNLQHANAVINYDLPWNPMRIEQRIGRVHRATQTRDVHVANLFSTGTIDEYVYRILVEKLRMFEMLFGQVTTILGEMEDAASGKLGGFEGQVKHALYAANDAVMKQRLEALATSAGEAWAKADAQTRDDGGFSAWFAPMREHRATMQRDAAELRPASVTLSGDRHAEACGFVVDWLTGMGARVEHRTSNFVSALLPTELQHTFGSDRVHLAFSPSALNKHPEAELCVIGSPVFEEFLAASAESGDLLGWTLDRARVDAVPPALAEGHPGGWSLAERRISPVRVAGGSTHWVVADEDTRREPEIHTFSWGDHQADPTVQVPNGGPGRAQGVDPLPLALGTASGLARGVLNQSVPALEQVRAGWESEFVAVHDEEVTRRVRHYEGQLNSWEVPWGERPRIEESLARLRAEPTPTVRVRCDLLSLELVSATTVDLVEVWRNETGARREVPGTFDARTGAITLRDAAGRPLRSLAFCDSAHPADAAEVAACSGCEVRSCPRCDEADWVTQSCSLCGGAFCSACQDPAFACALCERAACHGCSDSGMCHTCLFVEAAEEDDLAGLPAELGLDGLDVALGTDDDLTVVVASGAQRREAIVLDRESAEIRRWVSLGEADPARLDEVIRFVADNRLSGDVALGDDTRAAGQPAIGERTLVLDERRWTEQNLSAPGTGVQAQVQRLDEQRITRPTPQQREALEDVVPPTRGKGRPVDRLAVEVAVHVWLDGEGVHTWQSAGGTVEERVDPWGRWMIAPSAGPGQPADVSTRTCRASGVATCTLERADGALVLRVVPEAPMDRARVAQLGVPAVLGALGAAAGRLSPAHWLLPDGGEPAGPDGVPGAGTRVRRDLAFPRPSLVRLRLDGAEHELRLPAAASVPVAGKDAAGGLLAPRGSATAAREPRGGARDAMEFHWPTPVPVTETWSVDGVEFAVAGSWLPGEERVSLVDGRGAPIETVARCGRGHVTDASHIAHCASCARDACLECPEQERAGASCGVCRRTVCPTCRPAGRGCLLCGRNACEACLDGRSLCRPCAGVDAEPASPGDVPAPLSGRGMRVLRTADADVSVLRLVGGSRREVAVIDSQGAVVSWWTLAPHNPGLLAEALAVTTRHDLPGDVRPVADMVAASVPELPADALEVSRVVVPMRRWRHDQRGLFDAADGTPVGGPAAAPVPRRPHVPLFAALDVSTEPCEGRAPSLTLESTERVVRIAITGDGLVEDRVVGRDATQRASRWAAVLGLSVGAGLPAGVEAAQAAKLPGGVSATIATLGPSFRFLILNVLDRTRVWDLDGAAGLAAELAFGQAATGTWVPRRPVLPVPVAVPWAAVAGVEGRDPMYGQPAWRARPVGSDGLGRVLLGSDGRPAQGDAAFALDLPPREVADTLPTALATAIDALVPRVPAGDAEPMQVLLQQPFTVRTPEGRVPAAVVVVSADLAAPEFVDADGASSPSVVVCSAGHVGPPEGEQHCRYCGSIRCRRCAVRTSPCPCCGITMCRSCTPPSGRCPACSVLTKIGMFQKGRWVKQYPSFVAGFKGADAAHGVVLLLLAEGVVVRETTVGSSPARTLVSVERFPELQQQFRKWLGR